MQFQVGDTVLFNYLYLTISEVKGTEGASDVGYKLSNNMWANEDELTPVKSIEQEVYYLTSIYDGRVDLTSILATSWGDAIDQSIKYLAFRFNRDLPFSRKVFCNTPDNGVAENIVTVEITNNNGKAINATIIKA